MTQETRSLAPVIEILPAECYDNPTWKGLAYVARDLAVYAAVLLGLFYADRWWLLIPLWLLSGLVVSALFILGHDAAHGALFRSRRLCYWVGQLCMLPALHMYEAWVLGHNRLHHGHTVRAGADFVWHPFTREQYDALSPLAKLRHRLEWSALGGGLYYLREVWWNKMVRFDPPAKLASAIRRDWWVVVGFFALATLALGAAGFAHYGTAGGAVWTWFKLGIVPWLLFNYTIGIAVYLHHIADDLPWHPRSQWNKFKGQMQGTTIFTIPRGLDFFFHHIFLHVPHHVDMRIPFYRLPAAARAIQQSFGDVVRARRLRLRDYLRTVRRCKLFDFERGVWSTYDGRVTTPAAEARQAA
jgi:omega-6 fatty acid desaturase (delta-12 desaturase)